MTISDEILTTMPAEPLAAIAERVTDGDVLLCAATDLGSRLISWSTRSRWTHVALAYRWESLARIMVFESVHTRGVHAVPIETFVKRTSGGVTPYPGSIILARHEDFQTCIDADPAAKKRLGDFAVDRFGDPFATQEIVKIALRIMLGRAKRPLPPILAPDNEFICSEYVAKCLQQVGIEVRWDAVGFLAPEDFARDPKIHAVACFQT